jgi:hypothetical protein
MTSQNNLFKKITTAYLISLAFCSLLRAERPGPASPAPGKKPRIEVCFVLDTTGSMGGLIEGARQKIWSIANDMISAKPTPELKIGLVGYRDLTLCDPLHLPTTSTPCMDI